MASSAAMPDVAERADVVVVGAGPAGAVTAALLAGRGHRVIVLERSGGPYEKICGEYVCPRAAQNLARLGLLREIGRRNPRPIGGMLLVAPDGTEVAGEFRARDGTRRDGFSLPRQELDGALQDEARGRGATIRFDATVADLEGSPDGADVRALCGRERTPVHYHAAVVVGADGRASCVARRLGLTSDLRGPSRGVIHAWFRGVEAVEDRGEMHLFADGSYLGLDPLADGRVNAGLVVDAARVAEAARARNGEAVLRAALVASRNLRPRFARAAVADEVRYLSPVRHDVERVAAPRALLVGDAAGFLDPLTGEGIHFAIAQAELAAGAIASALARGEFGVAAPRAPFREYGQAVAALRRGKTLLHPMLQGLLRRPRLANALGARLRRAPAAAERLLAVIGSLRGPAALAHPAFLAALLRPAARAAVHAQ